MARPINPLHLEHESRLASISTAGVRPLDQTATSVSPGASAEATYTISDEATRRAVIAHLATNDDDIRFALNETADANSYPVFSGVYFSVQVEHGDVLHFFNTTGGTVEIHVLEVR